MLVISLETQNSWSIFQLDVKSSFLHGDFQEEVFIDQPPGYEKKEKEDKVYKLKKELYGLKQAPRAWYSPIDAYFTKLGFSKCPFEHTLYVKNGGNLLNVSLYVHDLMFIGNIMKMFDEFKESMMKEFEVTDLGLMRYFFGLEVIQSTASNFIYQKKYAQEILVRFNMIDYKSFRTPTEPGSKLHKDDGAEEVDNTYFKKIVGSLMYLTSTRPDIMYAVR